MQKAFDNADVDQSGSIDRYCFSTWDVLRSNQSCGKYTYEDVFFLIRDEFRKAMELLNYVSSEAQVQCAHQRRYIIMTHSVLRLQVVAIFGSLDKHHTNHISVISFVERLIQVSDMF